MPAIRPCGAGTTSVTPHDDLPGTEFDDTAADLFAQMAADPVGRARLRDMLIESTLPLAVRLARHYQGRGEPIEDLTQVATVGLIKAIDGYDPERGPFSHYAGPTIRGELKKHFRDRGWSIRVPRRLQELKMEVARANQVLAHELGRAPTVADVAGYLRVNEEQVVEGMDLSHAYQPVSLDAPASNQEDGTDLGALLGGRDPAVESVDDRMTLAGLLPHLPEREQRILHLRFSGNLTQSQIAAEIGISQMHVSRLLSQTLAWLRAAMTADGTADDLPGMTTPDDGPLHVAVQRAPGGTVVIRVAGEIDHDSAGELRVALCETALADRPRQVRVHLGQVAFIDAAGAAALLAGRAAAQHGGADFRLEGLQGAVVEVLRHGGLAEVFGLQPAAAPVPRRRVSARAAWPTPPCPDRPGSNPTAARSRQRSAVPFR